MTNEEIIDASAADPAAFRAALKDPNVQSALEVLGVQLQIFELHAPAPSAKTGIGLGATLCGDRARRHPSLVTCKKCLKKIK